MRLNSAVTPMAEMISGPAVSGQPQADIALRGRLTTGHVATPGSVRTAAAGSLGDMLCGNWRQVAGPAARHAGVG